MPGIPLYTGPSNPANLRDAINNLILQINAGIGAAGTSGVFQAVRTITSGAVTVLSSDATIVINKSAGSPTAIALPTPNALIPGRLITVKDGKGDAATNNITISVTGGANIDGSASFIQSNAYQADTFQDTGSRWIVIS